MGLHVNFEDKISQVVSYVLISSIFFSAVYRIWQTCCGRQRNEAFSGKVAS